MRMATQRDMGKHVNTHRRPTYLSCTMCEKSYTLPYSLQRHEEAKHGIRGRPMLDSSRVQTQPEM